MNQRVKEIWVRALRSGEYPQGFGCLQDDVGGYCCFGVLEKLAVDEGVIPSFRPDQRYLSDEVVAWAGFAHWHPQVPIAENTPEEQMPLAYLNDGRFDFGFIADRIERYL